MSELLPKGEKLRRAVRFLSEASEGSESSESSEGDDAPTAAALIDQATLRFDLTPREAELLADFWRNRDS